MSHHLLHRSFHVFFPNNLLKNYHLPPQKNLNFYHVIDVYSLLIFKFLYHNLIEEIYFFLQLSNWMTMPINRYFIFYSFKYFPANFVNYQLFLYSLHFFDILTFLHHHFLNITIITIFFFPYQLSLHTQLLLTSFCYSN
jgi:hypothetical protein